MTLTAAISNALSGLHAATKGTEIVSSNLANNMTTGYARREVLLSPRTYYSGGGGVHIVGVQRVVSASILADSRLASAKMGASSSITNFHSAIEKSIGSANEPGTLSSAITDLDAKLTAAISRPDSEIRLTEVLTAAQSLASKINTIGNDIQSARREAEQKISSDVNKLNTALDNVAKLNRQIVTAVANGKDAASLIDMRQASIDSIAELVPIQEIPRGDGRISLFTKGGASLLDGQHPNKISFNIAPMITAQMGVNDGTLARLQLDGKELSERQMSMFSGGAIAAQFQIRDEVAPSYQRQVDAFAYELSDRFSASQSDPSLGASQPGLFTDQQNAATTANLAGLAQRLTINAAVDPAAGGNPWRLRAGMGALTPNSSGDSTQLERLSKALTDSRVPPLAGSNITSKTLLTFSSEIASTAATNRANAELDLVRDKTMANTLTASLLADGVDTDKEMESLLSLERAYAANAKVFQSANEMLDTILRMI